METAGWGVISVLLSNHYNPQSQLNAAQTFPITVRRERIPAIFIWRGQNKISKKLVYRKTSCKNQRTQLCSISKMTARSESIIRATDLHGMRTALPRFEWNGLHKSIKHTPRQKWLKIPHRGPAGLGVSDVAIVFSQAANEHPCTYRMGWFLRLFLAANSSKAKLLTYALTMGQFSC